MLDMNVVVTGGAGYIGSHASKALKQAGYTPIVIDDLSRGNRWAVKYGPLVQMEIQETSRLSEVFRQYRPVGVLHFAGLAYVWESFAKPERYFAVNTEGTRSVIEAMVSAQVSNLVFSSSCVVYGGERQEIFESHQQAPESPYGESKLEAEKLIERAVDAGLVEAHVLRYFNVAGADLGGELGELHSPSTRIVTKLLEVAAGQDKKFFVNGGDYSTVDGTCIRDYIHVEDLVHAHLLALESLLRSAKSDRFNLSLNRGYSVLDVIRTVEKVTGQEIAYEFKERRVGDPAILVGNSDKARRILKWRPKADLYQIVESAWRWQQKIGGIS